MADDEPRGEVRPIKPKAPTLSLDEARKRKRERDEDRRRARRAVAGFLGQADEAPARAADGSVGGDRSRGYGPIWAGADYDPKDPIECPLCGVEHRVGYCGRICGPEPYPPTGAGVARCVVNALLDEIADSRPEAQVDVEEHGEVLDGGEIAIESVFGLKVRVRIEVLGEPERDPTLGDPPKKVRVKREKHLRSVSRDVRKRRAKREFKRRQAEREGPAPESRDGAEGGAGDGITSDPSSPSP